ncbi:MAG: M23 family metallopeptidase [Muribaculaceae bacterium]|nr:M23 family metallopeptidase [Muribaculaceae bacterium]
MTFKRISAILLAAVAVSMGAQAQYRLPASHSRQHESLLSHQRPAAADYKVQPKDNILNDLREREALQDNEIFNYNWASQSVNAYQGMAIPATHDINVRNFVPPVKGQVTSPYGWRAQFGRMHRGVDLRLSVGDTVVAAFDGKIRITKIEPKGYGLYVVVRHDNGLETVYGHLSKFLVKPNQRVRAGEPIALGGNTGRSTGPHLHFETRFLGLAVNPEAIIDFQHGVTHKDIFTFNKASYDKSQKYGPRKRQATASKKKLSKKATASAKKKSKKASAASTKRKKTSRR